MTRDLAVVPNSVVDRQGQPRFGTFRGELPAVSFRELSGDWEPSWWQWPARRKRWNYGIAVTDEVLLCQAVVQGGYFGQAFTYVVDLYEERAVAELKFTGAPEVQAHVNDRPSRGHMSAFRTAGAALETSRDPAGGAFRWTSRIGAVHHREPGGIELDARLGVEPVGPALTVISPVEDGGLLNVTQKWAGLPLEGDLRVGTRTYRLDGGLGAMDYTQGILARRTTWRWALALGRLFDGRSVGINLVEGFNEGREDTNENALWVGDRLIPLGRATFEFDRDHPDRLWSLTTECGTVELYFWPYHVYRDVRRWKIIDSWFIQPAGRFEGRLRIDDQTHEVSLYGVTEDQDILW